MRNLFIPIKNIKIQTNVCHHKGDFMVKGSVEITKVYENIRWVVVDGAYIGTEVTIIIDGNNICCKH